MRRRDYADDISEQFFEKMDAAFASGKTDEIHGVIREIAKAGAKASAALAGRTMSKIRSRRNAAARRETATGWAPPTGRRHSALNHYFVGGEPVCGSHIMSSLSDRRLYPWPHLHTCARCWKLAPARGWKP